MVNYIRQMICRHNYKVIAKHRHTQSNLWQCDKCNVFYIQHYGIWVGYKCRVPNIGGWVAVK